MKRFSQRKTARAKRYDYASPWMYFVTTCTKDRVHYFGNIVDTQTVLSDIGKICDEQLQFMMQKRPSIDMHAYIIMPNHVHLLFYMNERRDTGLPCPEHKQPFIRPEYSNQKDEAKPSSLPQNWNHVQQWNRRQKSNRLPERNQTLGSVIGGWKSAVSRHCHAAWYDFSRQSRYHDHIVRNETEYHRIKRYIQNNPAKRDEDYFHS